MGVRAFSCTYLLSALFLDLFVRETEFYFFPREVWLDAQEMQICFSFLTVCLPSFPAPPRSTCVCLVCGFCSLFLQLRNCRNGFMSDTRNIPSIPAQ